MKIEEAVFQVSDDLNETEEIERERKIFVLIIYDITENKKRNQLAKKLLGYGFRIQKSAFEAELSHGKYEQLIVEMNQFKNKEDETDSIRIYRFLGKRETIVIGKNEENKLEDIMFF